AFQPSVVALPLLAIGVMVASGILYMGAMLFYLRAIQSEEASVVAPLFQLNTIFTLLLAYLVLGERLTWLQIAGVALILAGALSLSIRARLFLRAFKPRLLVSMFAATFVLALSSVLFKYFAVEDSFWGTTFWSFVGEAVFGAVILAIPAYWRQFQ